MVFINLTKAFDTVNREGLWTILQRLGCPERLISSIRSFHEGMLTRVYECGELSDPFPVTNGAKQGCVLAPILFSILFSYILLDTAFKDKDKGVFIQFRTDGGLQTRTKTLRMVIRDQLYTDDCSLVAHTLEDIQQITNAFARAAERFGLTICIKRRRSCTNRHQGNPTLTQNRQQNASQICWQILLPRKHPVKLIDY